MTCSVVCMSIVFFFFKQKTAYEMRISDWSSDVCSSDLREDLKPVADQAPPVTPIGATRPPTNEELTTPDAQAVPARSDELLKRSEQREPDDFDLPPPG